MANFNEILEGRFNRGLQKLFAIKGGPPVRQLGGEIMPVHPLRSGVENLWLEGWNRFVAFTDLTSGVGQIVGVRMRNPIGSNGMGVLEGLWSLNVTPASRHRFQLSYGAAQADLLGGTFAAFIVDSRAGIGLSSTISFSFAANATTLTTVLSRAAPVNTDVIWIDDAGKELTILPGESIQISQENPADGRTIVSSLWRERLLK